MVNYVWLGTPDCARSEGIAVYGTRLRSAARLRSTDPARRMSTTASQVPAVRRIAAAAEKQLNAKHARIPLSYRRPRGLT